jgi:hypothetical protein
MKKLFVLLYLAFLFFSFDIIAQTKEKKYNFYGGFGLGISNNYTYISLQPGIVYHWNTKFHSGVGVQYSYIRSHNSYDNVRHMSNIFGFNLLSMYYPANYIEFSVEFEDLFINQKYGDVNNNYWSPALFGGMAYRYGNVIAGLKYNFLFDEKTSIYKNAFAPFIRIHF